MCPKLSLGDGVTIQYDGNWFVLTTEFHTITLDADQLELINTYVKQIWEG